MVVKVEDCFYEVIADLDSDGLFSYKVYQSCQLPPMPAETGNAPVFTVWGMTKSLAFKALWTKLMKEIAPE